MISRNYLLLQEVGESGLEVEFGNSAGTRETVWIQIRDSSNVGPRVSDEINTFNISLPTDVGVGLDLGEGALAAQGVSDVLKNGEALSAAYWNVSGETLTINMAWLLTQTPGMLELCVRFNDIGATQQIFYISIVDKVAQPVITPAGGTFSTGSSVLVSMSCTAVGAEIYYTTDGSNPETNGILYSAPFTVSATSKIIAVAKKDGMDNSDKAVSYINIGSLSFTPAPGPISETTYVSILGGADVMFIMYDTEGRTNQLYDGEPIEIQPGELIVAFAYNNYGQAQYAYGYYPLDTLKIQKPVITTIGDDAGGAVVTITCATPGAEIHYILDDTGGSINYPGADSPLYTGPFTISGDATVRAVALKSGMTDSDISSQTFLAPNSAPVAMISGDTQYSEVGYDSALVTLSAAGSYDPDGDELTYEWTINEGEYSL
jgi:hypothetical protein